MWGTRWVAASDLAIQKAVAALYHVLDTSRILENCAGLGGSVEPLQGVCCRRAPWGRTQVDQDGAGGGGSVDVRDDVGSERSEE